MKKLLKWIPAFLIMAIIFGLSSVRGEVVNATPAGNPTAQIAGHFFLFFSLCLSFYYATENILLAILLTVTYGVFDELHQIGTPMRSPSIFDIKVDTIGAMLAGFLVMLYKKFINKGSNASKA